MPIHAPTLPARSTLVALACLWLVALAALLAPRTGLAIDQSQLLPVEEAFALSARVSQPDRIDLRWEIAEGYYLYRHRARLLDVQGFEAAGELDLPPGEAYHDEFFGDVETYRHALDASLAGRLLPGHDTVTLEVTYQGCADIGICYPPHRQTLSIPAGFQLPAAAAPANGGALDLGLGGGTGAGVLGDAFGSGTDALPLPEARAFRAEAIADGPDGLLLRLTPAPGYYLYRDNTTMAVRAQSGTVTVGEVLWPDAVEHEDEFFGRSAVYFEPIDVPVRLLRSRTDATDITVDLVIQGCQVDGICYPPMQRSFTLTLPAGGTATLGERGLPGGGTGVSLWMALLLALGGGVILNLMPCVLPILSLKALSLAGGGHSPAHARRSAVWYTLGVLVSFGLIGLLVLALRSAGMALGWGFQLQQPLVIALLAYLMLVIGLNLSGVFNIGGRLAGVGQGLTEKPGIAGDFFTGVLAVLVASPCTAPFMGAALAFAFAAPPAVALGVFLALGLGLALPFLLIGFIPALAARLPRPGAWMDGFKQALAFPMYLVAAWLVWVLANQRGADAVLLLLIGAIVLAAGLWWFERRRFSGGPVARAVAIALILAAFVPVWMLRALPAPSVATNGASTLAGAQVVDVEAGGRVAYSPDALAALREAGRPVFVNMTADWCVTCKANERRVLAGSEFREALGAINGVYMVGDWTNVDPLITAFLEEHNAVGVPLYVVFPANGGPGRTLPTVLSMGGVRGALEAAAP